MLRDIESLQIPWAHYMDVCCIVPRVVIPSKLRSQVLELLHEGYLGIRRMQQLARTAVYWPNIDNDNIDLCSSCTACAERQNRPSKPPIHPWMVPAVNFMGSYWLVLVDAYSKYPCIHLTQSIFTKSTVDLLEHDFSGFWFPRINVTDNAPCLASEEFKERQITHLTGAPYHPSTNGAAERLVQTFKLTLQKSMQFLKKSFPGLHASVQAHTDR